MLEDAPKINRSLPIPLYYQLKERILTEIKNGDYPRDSIIPTELELSSMFDLSRTTVRQAISELVQEGWLYRLPSKGTFVGSPKISQDLIKKIKSFNQTITEQGMIPRTEVITLKKIKASIVDSKIVPSLV